MKQFYNITKNVMLFFCLFQEGDFFFAKMQYPDIWNISNILHHNNKSKEPKNSIKFCLKLFSSFWSEESPDSFGLKWIRLEWKIQKTEILRVKAVIIRNHFLQLIPVANVLSFPLQLKRVIIGQYFENL